MASDESAHVSLEEYARVQTALRSAPAEQHAGILREHGIDPEDWRTADAYWRAEIDKDAKHGQGELLLRWADAKEAAAPREPDEGESVSTELPPVSAAPVVVQAIPTFLRADAVKPAPGLGEARAFGQAQPVAPAPPALIRGSTTEVDTRQIVGRALPFAPAKPGEAPAPIPIPAAPSPVIQEGSKPPPNGQAMTLPIGYVLKPDAGHTETLDGYAAVFAQVAVSPKQALEICLKNGIPDDAAWKALQRRWTERLSADPELYREWFKLYTKYRAAFERK